MKDKTEAEIARFVVEELQRQGYVTYEEVSGKLSKRADIVAVRGPVTAVIECKRALSLRFLDQLTPWLSFANVTIGAYQSGRVGPAVGRYCRSEGIGLWAVHPPEEIVEKVAPRIFRQAGVNWLRDALCDEQRSGEYAQAGSMGGGYFTPFRGTATALRRIVEKQPGIELRAALQAMKHHYASEKSAMTSLPALIRKGVVQGIRLDDTERRLRLFPQ